jgi:hypothetical protein
MPLDKPALTQAQPGRPVTAQAWNAILEGLDNLYDVVAELGGSVVAVTVSGPGGGAVPGARVTATPLSDVGQPVEGIAPYPGSADFTVVGVTPGPWRIHVIAPAFRDEARDIIVPTSGPVLVQMVSTRTAVPDLFGVGAQEAVNRVTAAGLQVDEILDVTGQEIAKTNMPTANQNSPVLLQTPARGFLADPTVDRVRLVIAAALQPEATVTMPSLIGLTYDEVVSVLNRLGLVVGRTTTRQRGGAPPQ